MKKLNVMAGIVFGLLSILQIVLGNALAAVATGLLAGGLLLSDVAYVTSPAKFIAAPLLTWRNLTSILLVGASLGLFGYHVGGALHKATHRANAETHAK